MNELTLTNTVIENQVVVLQFTPYHPEQNGDRPKFTMSITFVHETETSLCDTLESTYCQSCGRIPSGSTYGTELNATESKQNIFPMTFHMDTYKFSYVLWQLHCHPPVFHRRGDQIDQDTSYFFTVALYQPTKHYLDYKSNDITTMLMVEKRELEHSLNWLSTLGGAFSALGENSDSFAKRAGKVSKGQLIIALKLRDPQTMSRCRLYSAISFLQLGKLKIARKILLREWAYANSLPTDTDPRLKRMCIGIWSKLQWAWKQKKRKNGDYQRDVLQ